MSDATKSIFVGDGSLRGIGDNDPPLPTFPELLDPETVAAIIAAELDREPIGSDGQVVPSIRARDPALVASCQRFLAAYPEITSAEAERVATELLSVCGRFAGGTGRVETARKTLKEPVLAAGRTIDAEFATFGTQLVVRPLTGPAKDRRQKPYTLAEQVNERLAAYKDKVAAREAAEAKAEADRLAKEAVDAEALANAGKATFADAAAVAEAAEKAEAKAAAPVTVLTKGGDYGSSSRKRIRIMRIVAPHLIPRQYCVPSESLIRAAMGAADSPMPVIAGCEFEDVTDTNRR